MEVTLGRYIASYPARKQVKADEDVTFLGMEDISEDGRVLHQHILSSRTIKAGLTYFERGDVLVAKITPCFENGKGACLDALETPVGFGSTEFHVLKAAKDAVPHYIYYITQSLGFRRFLEPQMTGTAGQKRVQLDSILNYPLATFHTKDEQQRIATALSDLDTLIDALDQAIVKKRDIVQGTMQQLLTGKRRLPGFSGDWKVKRLGQIAEIAMGRTPRRNRPEYWGRGYKWISIADLKSKYIHETKEEITALAAADMAVIPKGTLIMSFKLTIGKLAFTGSDMYSNEAICSFSKLHADADFLYYILGQTDFSLYGKQAVKGFTLNTESLNAVEIPYPPIPEQQAIATVLGDMDADIAALEQRRDKTQAVKQGMLQDLLSGKRRVM